MAYWVARDKDGTLWLYRGKPRKTKKAFKPKENSESVLGVRYLNLPKTQFRKVTWYNSPVKAGINLLETIEYGKKCIVIHATPLEDVLCG